MPLHAGHAAEGGVRRLAVRIVRPGNEGSDRAGRNQGLAPSACSDGPSGSEKSAWRKQNDKPKRIKCCPLPEQQKSPTDQLPQVVCVMMDGGRIQVRDRHENEPNTQGYWKESLVGCCLSMVSEEQLRDPCPTIPKTFVDPQRMHDLSREIKGIFRFHGRRRGASGGVSRRSPRPPRSAGAKRGRYPRRTRSVWQAVGRRSAQPRLSRARARRSWPMDRPATGRCIENTSRTTPRSRPCYRPHCVRS